MSFAFAVMFAMIPSSLLVAAAVVALLHDHPCFAVFFALLSVVLYPNVKQDPGSKAEYEKEKEIEDGQGL